MQNTVQQSYISPQLSKGTVILFKRVKLKKKLCSVKSLTYTSQRKRFSYFWSKNMEPVRVRLSKLFLKHYSECWGGGGPRTGAVG